MKKHGLVKKCMTFALGAALIMGMAGCGPAGSDSGSGQDANETSGTEAAREGPLRRRRQRERRRHF